MCEINPTERFSSWAEYVFQKNLVSEIINPGLINLFTRCSDWQKGDWNSSV